MINTLEAAALGGVTAVVLIVAAAVVGDVWHLARWWCTRWWNGSEIRHLLQGWRASIRHRGKVRKAVTDFATNGQFDAVKWRAAMDLLAGTAAVVPVPPDPPMPPVEYVGTEVLGWRGWGLTLVPGPDTPSTSGGELMLMSPHRATYWTSPALKAHERPEPWNGAGIYVVKQRKSERAPWLSAHLTEATVFGEVALSGRVIECADGYRGEQAVIRSLYLNPPNGMFNPAIIAYSLEQIAAELSARYGVEVGLACWLEEPSTIGEPK